MERMNNYKFKKTVRSRGETLEPYPIPDYANALDVVSVLHTVTGILTNKGGHKCEVTSDDEDTLDLLCTTGIDINGEHICIALAQLS